ncbi:MAG: DarT ssDNA thymidine ADP-ribosyltransferase family protein, partial [Nitrososphaeraceae archaeon]
FYTAEDGIQALDRDLVYARYWTNAEDPFDAMIRKSVKCAEILVPDTVNPRFVIGAHVANARAFRAFEALSIQLPVAINSGMFF